MCLAIITNVGNIGRPRQLQGPCRARPGTDAEEFFFLGAGHTYPHLDEIRVHNPYQNPDENVTVHLRLGQGIVNRSSTYLVRTSMYRIVLCYSTVPPGMDLIQTNWLAWLGLEKMSFKFLATPARTSVPSGYNIINNFSILLLQGCASKV
jgi:hypothetical protein